jgi:hypothetical protein
MNTTNSVLRRILETACENYMPSLSSRRRSIPIESTLLPDIATVRGSPSNWPSCTGLPSGCTSAVFTMQSSPTAKS